MKITDCYKIAKGNLSRSKIRSRLTMLGVIVSISAIVILVSLGMGLQHISVTRIASLTALTKLTVSSKEGLNSNKIDEPIIEKIKSLPNIQGVSPELQYPAQMSFFDSQSDVIAMGMNAECLPYSDLVITNGETFKNGENEVIISKAVLKLFGKENDPDGVIGKETDFKVVTGLLNKEMVKEREIKAKVVGVTADETLNSVYMPLSILKTKDVTSYNTLNVKVSDRKYVKETKTIIESMGFQTTTISDLVDQIDQAFLYFQIILGVIGGIALFVAAIGIINTMTISLLERTHEIGIMKAVGASNWDIAKIFLYEAGIMGFTSSLYGLLTGWLIGKLVNVILLVILRSNNIEEDLTLFIMPINFAIFIFCVSTGLALFAGIYPAIRAARLSPLQALKSQ
jgi:putative ABC transport system permease protein